MKRLNVNLAENIHARVTELARAKCLPVGEVARRLIAEALGAHEREEFARAVRVAYTPELRERDLLIAAAIEKLRG